MIKTICLNRPKKIFPSKITRISPHDFLNLRVNKARFLTKNERRLFEEMADQGTDHSLIQYSDLLITRKGRCIKIQDL